MFGLVCIIKVFPGFHEMFLLVIFHIVFLLLGRHCEWYCSRTHFYLALIHPQVRWWWKTLFKILYVMGLVPVAISVVSPRKGITAPILSLGRLVWGHGEFCSRFDGPDGDMGKKKEEKKKWGFLSCVLYWTKCSYVNYIIL